MPAVWHTRKILLAASFCIVFTVPAVTGQTNTALQVSIAIQPTSPIGITNCFAGLADTSVGNVDYYVWESVQFVNVADATVTAIRFRFDLSTSFDEPLTSLFGTMDGEFSHGVNIDKAHAPIGTITADWSNINIWPGAHQIVCSVDTVRFANGQIWKAKPSQRANLLPVHSVIAQ